MGCGSHSGRVPQVELKHTDWGGVTGRDENSNLGKGVDVKGYKLSVRCPECCWNDGISVPDIGHVVSTSGRRSQKTTARLLALLCQVALHDGGDEAGGYP